MQLLFTSSEEDETPCLDIIPAQVRRFQNLPNLPIPHMGWNEVELGASSPLLEGVGAQGYAYFVHSFAAPVGNYTRATADYGGKFSAVIEHGNFFGTQFHPERSAALGAQILTNFVGL
jgi:glutamine amidotransferase